MAGQPNRDRPCAAPTRRFNRPVDRSCGRDRVAVPVDTKTRRLLTKGEELAAGEPLLALLDRALGDHGLRAELRRDPQRALRAAGVRLPRELSIRFSAQPRLTPMRPAPGWFPFSIRLTRCRTVWIADPDDDPTDERRPPPRQQTICFGFEIVRNRPPGGPIG